LDGYRHTGALKGLGKLFSGKQTDKSITSKPLVYIGQAGYAVGV
jgi:hypothetical protein